MIIQGIISGSECELELDVVNLFSAYEYIVLHRKIIKIADFSKQS